MRLLDEYGEALEADLLSHYQVDLCDVWRGRLDWRRLRVLVLGLPPSGTALARAVHGTAAGDWTSTDELLRKLVTVAQDHAWAFFETNRDTKEQPQPIPRPEPIPSPFGPAPDEAEVPERLTVQGARVADASQTMALLQNALG